MDDTTRRDTAQPRWPEPDEEHETDVDAGPDPLVGARLADLPPVAATLVGDPPEDEVEQPEA